MPLDAQDKIALEGLEHRFTYHPPQDATQVEDYKNLRAKALELAKLIVVSCPSSAERSTALTHLDGAIFFANAAIARHGYQGTEEGPGKSAGSP